MPRRPVNGDLCEQGQHAKLCAIIARELSLASGSIPDKKPVRGNIQRDTVLISGLLKMPVNQCNSTSHIFAMRDFPAQPLRTHESDAAHWNWFRPHRAFYFNFSSQSNSVRVSHELTVFTALFFSPFSAQSSWSSDMFTWAKRNLPAASAV